MRPVYKHLSGHVIGPIRSKAKMKRGPSNSFFDQPKG